jgi:hypothetical protein
LDEIAKLHDLPQSEWSELDGEMPPEFNAALYRWEQNYFFENCLGRIFGVDEGTQRELASLPALEKIADRLAKLPRVLVHRDFQSQNIIVRGGHAYLIDFQGMRPGLAEYDVASLLFDPYVRLSPVEREGLWSYYRERRTRGLRSATEARQALRLCAMQRLMQALGAYGFLGLVKGNLSSRCLSRCRLTSGNLSLTQATLALISDVRDAEVRLQTVRQLQEITRRTNRQLCLLRLKRRSSLRSRTFSSSTSWATPSFRLTNNTAELMNSTGLFACPSNFKKLKRPIGS